MATYSPPPKEPWQTALSQMITDPRQLFALLDLDQALLPEAYRIAQLFPLRVTQAFVKRMKKKDVTDPLLRQVLPLALEAQMVPGYTQDPLQEQQANPVPGLIHRYYGRVLVTLTGVCAIHCRYCFRRHFPYAQNNPGREGWRAIFHYLAAHPEIEEVILSGGDPLCATENILYAFSEQLNALPQVKRLRLHTRLPIVLPERVNDALITWMMQLKQQCVVVIHANHPSEMDEAVSHALLRLATASTVLNQAVLLKGVNDEAACLIQLSRVLFEHRVLPYYLNLLDKVAGVAHFEVSLTTARALYHEMLKQLPGYLVPKLVYDQPQAAFKHQLCYKEN